MPHWLDCCSQFSRRIKGSFKSFDRTTPNSAVLRTEFWLAQGLGRRHQPCLIRSERLTTPRAPGRKTVQHGNLYITIITVYHTCTDHSQLYRCTTLTKGSIWNLAGILVLVLQLRDCAIGQRLQTPLQEKRDKKLQRISRQSMIVEERLVQVQYGNQFSLNTKFLSVNLH
jgi:hypothetical protein